jgi:hypothetical protein
VSQQIDIRVTIDGVPVPLPVAVATMVLAVVDHREAIHKQGTGCVLLDYHHEGVGIDLLRRNYKAKARRLTLSVS